MKVLLVTSHLNAGGITSYTLSLASALQRKGLEVFLASGGGQFEKKLTLPHFDIGIHTKCEMGPCVLKGIFKLRGVVKRHGIDLIHAQTRVAAVTSAVVSRLSGIPFLTTAHGFYRPHWGRRMFQGWGKRVIAISTQVLEHLKKDFKVSRKIIRLIHNGTDFNRYQEIFSQGHRNQEMRKMHLDPHIPLIGIVARLSPVKGHHYLLQAVSELNKDTPVQCLVVGDGPSREEFLKQKESLKLNGLVQWIPWLDDSSKVLGLLDIFVLPSLQEGLSLSILEAQAAGVPVVASNVGGISEVVIDGRTGILVPPHDVIALKEALRILLKDRSLAQRMGCAGRERVKKEFSLDRMADEVIKVYQEVVDK